MGNQIEPTRTTKNVTKLGKAQPSKVTQITQITQNSQPNQLNHNQIDQGQTPNANPRCKPRWARLCKRDAGRWKRGCRPWVCAPEGGSEGEQGKRKERGGGGCVPAQERERERRPVGNADGRRPARDGENGRQWLGDGQEREWERRAKGESVASERESMRVARLCRPLGPDSK